MEIKTVEQLHKCLINLRKIEDLAHYHHNFDAICLYTDLMNIFKLLPQNLRDIITLRCFLQYNNVESSKVIGCTPSNASQNWTRALRRFTQLYQYKYRIHLQ